MTNEVGILKIGNVGEAKFLSGIALIFTISLIFFILVSSVPIENKKINNDQIIITDIDGSTKIVNKSYLNPAKAIWNISDNMTIFIGENITISKKAKAHMKPAPPEKYYTITGNNKVIEGPANYSTPDKKSVPENYEKLINKGPVVFNINGTKGNKDDIKEMENKVRVIDKNVTLGIKNDINKISASNVIFVNFTEEDIENYKKNYEALERKADEELMKLSSKNIWENKNISIGNKTKLGKLDPFLGSQINFKEKYMDLNSKLVTQPNDLFKKEKNKVVSMLENLGTDLSKPSVQNVFIYFDHELTENEIKKLNKLGANIDKNSWIPPVGVHLYGFYTGSIPANLTNLHRIANMDFVRRISSAEGVIEKSLDKSVPLINADVLWNASEKLNAPKNYTGKGIKIAVIDAGINVSHPDIKGRVDATWNYDTGSSTIDSDSHGTATACIALGNGSIYRGVAPNAQLIALQANNPADVVTAIKNATDVFGADVISISLTSPYIQFASHRDGLDPWSQAIDYAASKGVVVVIAAGNAGDAQRHVNGTLKPGKSMNFTLNMNSNKPAYLFLVWNLAYAHNDFDFTIYDKSNGAYLLSTDECSPPDTDPALCWDSQYNGQSYSSQDSFGIVHDNMYVPISSASNFTIIVEVTNNGEYSQSFDLYQEIDNSNKFVDGNIDPYKTIAGTSTARGALTVGSYSYSGGISKWSSRGPTMNGRIKPDVVAPGENISSCNIIGGYSQLSGTSFATPHVAGAVALLLETDPLLLDSNHIKEAIIRGARTVSGYDNNTMGYGLINVSASYTIPDLMIRPQDISFSIPFEGESTTINVTVHNIGGTNKNNVNVNFSLTGILPSSPIIYTDLQTVSVSAHSNKTIQFTWPQAAPGTHKINVTIFPQNDELFKTNNQAEKLITTITPSVDLYSTDLKCDPPLQVGEESNISTVVHLIDNSSPGIVIYPEKNVVSWFDVVEYTIVIANPSSETAHLENLTVVMSRYLKYINHSAMIDSEVVNPQVTGNTNIGQNLTWNFDCRNILPGNVLKITYKVLVLPGFSEATTTAHLYYSTQKIATTVNFYEDEISEDNLIGSDTVIMPCNGGNETASIKWTPEHLGQPTIKELVDPDNSIIESNEINNEETIQGFVNHQLRHYSWAEGGNDYELCTNQVLISGDDNYAAYTLPFTFPIYDSHYGTIYVSTNGYITFDGGSTRYWSISDFFKNAKMIAAEGGDLVSTVYVCNHEDYVTFRWVGKHFGHSDSVDVEVRLFENGNIKINQNNIGDTTGYGVENVVGVSRGDNLYYTQLSSGNSKAYIFSLPWEDYSWSGTGYTYDSCNTYLLNGDDNYAVYNLPFTFQLYDYNYSKAYLGTNGYITFDGGTYQWWDIGGLFKSRKMIAVEGGDLVTTIYACNYGDHVTFRWVGRHYGNSYSIDVEAILYSKGNIKINQNSIGATSGYGTENVVGISRGDNSHYERLTPGNSRYYILFRPPPESI